MAHQRQLSLLCLTLLLATASLAVGDSKPDKFQRLIQWVNDLGGQVRLYFYHVLELVR